jgi:ketosteroid isomerase-like protein
MSGENVEVVRAAHEAWNAGDMEAFRDLHDPDVIGRSPEGWPEPGPFVGREAAMREFEQLRETWDVDTLHAISDFVDLGDRVAVRVTWRGAGRGPAAGIEVTQLITVRKGRILAVEYFWDHAEALEALGLSEDTTSDENVEIVRRFVDLARDDPDAVWDIFDEDVEWELDPAALALPDFPPASHGPDGIRDFFRRLVGAFEEWDYEAEEWIEAPDAVAVRIHHWGRGKGSGAPVEARFWQVWILREGKAVRVTHHIHKTEALKAAGLRE